MDLNACACSGKTLARLLRPALLTILSGRPMHGYVLLQKLGELQMFASGLPDASGVYKTLKAMEKEGLVTSSWELGESGPAKRLFSLTPAGRDCLKRWTTTLQEYRAQIDDLLAILGKKPRAKSAVAAKTAKSCVCQKPPAKR